MHLRAEPQSIACRYRRRHLRAARPALHQAVLHVFHVHASSRCTAIDRMQMQIQASSHCTASFAPSCFACIANTHIFALHRNRSRDITRRYRCRHLLHFEVCTAFNKPGVPFTPLTTTAPCNDSRTWIARSHNDSAVRRVETSANLSHCSRHTVENQRASRYALHSCPV